MSDAAGAGRTIPQEIAEALSVADTPEKRVSVLKLIFSRAAEERRKREEVKITSIEGAMRWGDSWMQAHGELYRESAKQADEYETRILILETDLQIEQCERLIAKHAFEDEVKRLRELVK